METSQLARELRPWPGILVWLIGAASAAVAGGIVPSISLAGEPASVRREIIALVGQLDSNRFETRREAVERLERLKASPEARIALAEEFQRLLLSPGTPFEVRRQVERLRAGLPAAAGQQRAAAPPEEIERIVGQLEDDQYGVRLGAARRLEWLLEDPKLACAIYTRLKQRLDRADLSLDARRWLEPTCVKARGAWLTSDPAGWDLPPVADSQIQAWVDELAQPDIDAGAADRPRARERAAGKLRDLLARNDAGAKVQQALEARLARGGLDPRAVRRLSELVELAQPAMIAEFWQGRRHLNTQHLLIGVPSRAPGADRASHFEYVDDHTAFCVSGQNLTPGQHPVGVAIPHPKMPGAMFHLVNLSTPRHKMAYACWTHEDEKRRLAQITRRTLQPLLDARQRLALEELLLLEQLDPAEVSRFAGPYFLAVEDQAIPPETADPNLGRPLLPGVESLPGRRFELAASRHGVLCRILATDGTRAVMPDLVTAIERGRFLPPSSKAPHRLPWIAALAIALRDPWPGADPWLAQAVGRSEALVVGRERAPELGATAAGVLLARRGREAVQFGLKEAEDSLLDSAGLTGYRFETPGSRQRIQQWWSEHQAKQSP